MRKTEKNIVRQSWLVPLLLVAVLSLLPIRTKAQSGDISGTDFYNGYALNNWKYDANGNGDSPKVTFRVCPFNDYGTDEGFIDKNGGLDIHVSKDGGNTWTKILNVKADYYGAIKSTGWEGCAGTGDGYFEGYGKEYDVVWKLPKQWRNCQIWVKSIGKWSDKDGATNIHQIDKTFGPFYTDYAFSIRQIEWNGDYTMTPDGTVTIPYKFTGGQCNTDGETHIATRINGNYSGAIGLRDLGGNYNAGTYSFKLSDLGYNMRSTFTIEPYHEFTHNNDKSSSNGTKYYNKVAGDHKFYPLPVATITKGEFNQTANTITITWTANNTNYQTGSHGTKWAIYRDGKFVKAVSQDETGGYYNSTARTFSYTDKGFANESNVSYEIYYIWKGWEEDKAKVSELKSAPFKVNTTRTVPVRNLTAVSHDDKIVFTWSSDAYAQGWGNEFRIYVDDETKPIYTITPGDKQTDFTWEHRSTNQHSNRVNGIDGDVYYTEEKLNACDPHNYRVEGAIKGKKLNEASVSKRAIGNGTLFYSLDATKGVYPGMVKLSWHVDLQGSKDAKTYVIERRRTENENEAWATLDRFSSKDDYLLYSDDTPLPGIYYDYRVTVIDLCDDGNEVTNNITTIGFAQTTGTISGRVTYGSSGTSVAGVDVKVLKTGSSADDNDQYHSIIFTESNGMVTWEYPDNKYAAGKFAQNDFSMQFWVSLKEYCDSVIARFDKNTGLGIRNNGQVVFYDDGAEIPFNLNLKEDLYTNLVLTRSADDLVCYLIERDADGITVVGKDSAVLADTLHLTGATQFELGHFKGYADEFRLWTKCLSEAEITDNYDHLLVGNEKKLETYWTFDEGLNTQFFDYSRDGTVFNQHHGKIGNNTESASFTPDALSLKARTDVNGNYIIQGVPFSGEGSTYAIVPELGIHDFNPTQQLRYVSNNSLVHNGTDFDDVSSFPVSGKVMYCGTTYPVEGANLYVDGVLCTKDGEMITTNAYGEFNISVPIGQHFIQVKMNGHEFVNDGRYPADPNGTGEAKFTFDRKVTGLEFRDTTLVNFTGRVVGGDIENDNPVGFGLSKNNIGITRFTLTALNDSPFLNAVKNKISDTSFEYDFNPDIAPVPSATDKINSKAWRGAGIDDCRTIFIETDSLTGEFSAMLPPLEYAVGSMIVKSSGTLVGGNVTIDLTNPRVEKSDTLHDESGDILYTYNTKLNQVYHSEPVFTVLQRDHEDGSFGISEYQFSDVTGIYNIDDIYQVDQQNHTVSYKYGAPLFIMEDPYIFDLHGYENYVNSDNPQSPVVSKVPLKGSIVTINNALSASQSVYLHDGDVDGKQVQAGQVSDLKSNQLELDENGKAEYKWMAGYPNIAGSFKRTISMTYDINGREYQWTGSGMEAIVLGDLPTGSNFVTSGPDKLDMILRDPPGSGSSAEWSSGTTTTKSTALGNTMSQNNSVSMKHKFGFKAAAIAGALTPATITATITEAETKDELEVGVKMESELEDSKTIETSVTITHTIATSGETDYVGADGDLFIGRATNILFGKSREVGFQRNGNDFELGLSEVVSTGLQFATAFSYSQYYIKNTLIPNFKLMRSSLLEHVDSQSFIDNFVNNEERTRYLTLLTPDSEDYGKEGTYKVFLPKSKANVSFSDPIQALAWAIEQMNVVSDSVKWINGQIKNWESYLEFNEMEKVKAFNLRDDRDSVKCDNYSFDGGASVTHSVEKDSTSTSTREWTVSAGLVVNNETGVEVNSFGFDLTIEDETTGGRHETHEESTSYNSSFSYTLAEEGIDAISVDVYEYGAFGPIFRTRGGQTSNPYEGKVTTEYYNEGTVIMEATMQIEVPQIEVDIPRVSDVPTGMAANYTLRLSNISEIGEDIAYLIFMLDETNPDGAQLSIDGKVLTEGRLIKVPGNQTLTKTLQLRQTNVSILDYDSIGVVFASESQPDEIADTIYISAFFTPSSSPVTLSLSNTTMNTQLGDVLNITFKDFDRNYHNLKAFRIQYKKEGATNWTQLREYVLSAADTTGNNVLLPKTGASVTYSLPMKSFSDGDYIFRVVSAATYGTSEVYRYSDEIALIKDMQKPRPMGQPEPSDGVLDIGDDLSITFNESIVKGELTKENNFTITGVLNGAEVAHETALSLNNGSAASATAKTEAVINLSGKDFSIDAWVNITGAGTILSHGQGSQRLTVGTDADGKFVVTIAGNTYTSGNSVPTGKWAFLTMNLTAKGKLSATVASADETVNLFTDKSVAAYEGDGTLSVGCGAAAAIHELLLWDEAHDLATALLNRSKTKAPQTRHLIGYWKMNEGEGTQIRDYARNRHMTMTDETWYINNENKAVRLDGQHYISFNTTALPISDEDDYAVEFWMRGGSQAGAAHLLQIGDVSLWLDEQGILQFKSMATTSGKLNDNAWHHIAVNVLRQGAAAVYVDGKRCLTTNAANVGGINGDRMVAGVRRTYVPTVGGVDQHTYDNTFNGYVDEIRVWGATMNSDLIANNRKVRFTGKEEGLIAYYPFEKKTLDDYNQIVTVGDAKDMTESGYVAELKSLTAGTATMNFVDEAPALRTKPAETNVNFTFTANNEKIVIEIDEDPATIEGCTLNFNVRNIRDLNGNYSVPAKWSAFVSRKHLAWDDDMLSIEQQVKQNSSFTATIINKGGQQQMWSLTGLPAWLTASADYGVTNPRSETTVTFTVSPATPIGKYEETIYLTGNDGIDVPLTIDVKVTGQEPKWAVNPKSFENSMNLIGRLDILGHTSEDEDDIVAAFVGDECRGVAHPVYNERYGAYYVTMDIYGNFGDSAPLTFRAYDASTGVLYPEVVADPVLAFQLLNLKGTYAEPVKLTALNKIEQQTELKAGWNWLSLYVTNEDMTVATLFNKIGADVITIKSQNDGYLTFEEGSWGGNLTGNLSNGQMYAVKMKRDRTLSIVGERVEPANNPVTVYNGWNWIGYYGNQVSTVSDALADLSAVDGNIIKAQRGVAYFDSYEWSGSLQMMEPGEGYMLKTSLGEGQSKLFRYPSSVVNLAPLRSPARMAAAANTNFTFRPVDFRNYSGNATMAVKVLKDNVPLPNAEVGVFADGECRAAAVTNSEGIAFLTIPGDDAVELTFKVADGAQITDIPCVVNYQTDAIYGSPKNPVLFGLGDITGIRVIESMVDSDAEYDLMGRKAADSQKGIRIREGKKIFRK